MLLYAFVILWNFFIILNVFVYIFLTYSFSYFLLFVSQIKASAKWLKSKSNSTFFAVFISIVYIFFNCMYYI